MDCEPPELVEIKVVGDLVENYLRTQEKYQICAARMKRLKEWYQP